MYIGRSLQQNLAFQQQFAADFRLLCCLQHVSAAGHDNRDALIRACVHLQISKLNNVANVTYLTPLSQLTSINSMRMSQWWCN